MVSKPNTVPQATKCTPEIIELRTEDLGPRVTFAIHSMQSTGQNELLSQLPQGDLGRIC